MVPCRRISVSCILKALLVGFLLVDVAIGVASLTFSGGVELEAFQLESLHAPLTRPAELRGAEAFIGEKGVLSASSSSVPRSPTPELVFVDWTNPPQASSPSSSATFIRPASVTTSPSSSPPTSSPPAYPPSPPPTFPPSPPPTSPPSPPPSSSPTQAPSPSHSPASYAPSSSPSSSPVPETSSSFSPAASPSSSPPSPPPPSSSPSSSPSASPPPTPAPSPFSPPPTSPPSPWTPQHEIIKATESPAPAPSPVPAPSSATPTSVPTPTPVETTSKELEKNQSTTAPTITPPPTPTHVSLSPPRTFPTPTSIFPSHSSTQLPTAESQKGSVVATIASREPVTPQAASGSKIVSQKSKWSLLVIVGSIATVAMLSALLIWRDTQRSKRRSSVEETLPAHSKDASCDLKFDWYPQSPSLTSVHESVDTFMGRRPIRQLSEPHVSSRAASAGDLLAVSSLNNCSSRSDPSNRSQPIPEQAEEATDEREISRVAIDQSDTDSLESSQRSKRTNSSSQVSFDDNVNALSDWDGADYLRSPSDSIISVDADASVQQIFDLHHQAFLHSQDIPSQVASNIMSVWSLTVPRAFSSDAFRSSSFSSTGSEHAENFEFHDDGGESNDDENRDSDESMFLADASTSTAILGELSCMMSSFHSDWSDVTSASDDNDSRGSDRSIGTYDEEL